MQREWWYDEFKQIGTDYASSEEVDRYDERMSSMRNFAQEAADILDNLALTKDSIVLDIGAGTGEFAIAAAGRCSQVYAVDISQQMLDCALRKATSRGITNIEFICAGFLTYEHYGDPVDAVVSQLALHHLSDFWKSIALRNIWRALKPGGKLFLRDVVFSFNADEAAEILDGWVANIGKQAGEQFAQEVQTHIRDEHSTFDWVMEGLLERSGFSILSANYGSRVWADYICKKQ